MSYYKHFNNLDWRNKSIYIFPNLFTSACMFSGFFAIILAFNFNFVLSAMCIYFAAVMDALDGRIARLTNTQTVFGAEYDSMADVVSFGVAPALVMYFWILKDLKQLGWSITFIYLACVALRLSRYNSYTANNVFNCYYFTGLPCTAAASVIAGLVWFVNKLECNTSTCYLKIFTCIIILYLSIMMVSNVQFKSFKYYDLKSNMTFIKIVFVLLIITCIIIKPSITLFIIFMCYSLSGIIFLLYCKLNTLFY